MLFSKSQPTPMVSSPCLSQNDTTTFNNASLYCPIVDSLQYLLIRRPELSYSVNKVCQFMHHPKQHHWKVVKRILHYLVGSQTHGLLLCMPSQLPLQAYVDANWDSNSDDRKSTTGYTVFLGQNLIAWTSNKQKVVSRSTTEVEYRSIATTLVVIKWTTNLHIYLVGYFLSINHI